MKIQWLGQSGYLLQGERTRLVIDPYLSDVVEVKCGFHRLQTAPMKAEELHTDYYVCTHDHLDHIDPVTVGIVAKEEPVFLCPASCVTRLRELEARRIQGLSEQETFGAGEFTVTAVYAKHTVDAMGVVVTWRDKKLYFSGDTLYDERLQRVRDFDIDVAFLCINGKLGNMSVEEAVRLTDEIRPKVGIPAHYGLFAENTEDPGKYTDAVEDSFALEHARVYELEELLTKKQGNGEKK